MRHFDENGNFIESPEGEEEQEYIYHYKKATGDDNSESL
jgi:hypothetical protein